MLVADFIPKSMHVFLHAENGILGLVCVAILFILFSNSKFDLFILVK